MKMEVSLNLVMPGYEDDDDDHLNYSNCTCCSSLNIHVNWSKSLSVAQMYDKFIFKWRNYGLKLQHKYFPR